LPAPDGARFAAVDRWFWRTTLSGYFGGWNTGQMTHDWRAVDSFATAPEVTEIDVPAALPRSDIWRVTQFRSNSAVSKMLALLLSYRDTVDLLTGQRIDPRRSLSWSNDKEFHHFFPKDYLRNKKITAARANAVANIVLLTSASNIAISNRAPSVYLRSIIDDVGRDELLNRASLSLVPEAAIDAALDDDYERFLQLRSDELHQVALDLVGEVGEDSLADLPPPEDEMSVDDPDATEVD
jgi:hypothetical protein